LDLGTGSGNITVALLKLLPEYRMVSLDISHGALEVARENAVRNNVMDRVHLVQGDVFQWLNAENAFSGQFSLVVSNPPYIKTDDLTRLPQEVKKEPVSALDGGEDGLIFYSHIISNIPHMLKPGGWIFFEIGETQGKSLDNLLTRQGSFVNIQVIKDFNQRDRIIKAQLKF
jgi:release factor glutamine methyltransferase